jgi:hypothetical protein
VSPPVSLTLKVFFALFILERLDMFRLDIDSHGPANSFSKLIGACYELH